MSSDAAPQSWSRRAMGWVVRHPWPVLLLHLLAFAGFGSLAGQVRKGVNVEDFFPRAAPARQTYDRMSELFPDDSWGTILIEAPQPSRRAVLEVIKALRQRLLEAVVEVELPAALLADVASEGWGEAPATPASGRVRAQVSIVYEVETVLDVKDVRARDGTLVPEALIPDVEVGDEALAARWEELHADERFAGSVMSLDGSMHALRVQMDPSLSGDTGARAAFRQVVREACAEAREALRELGDEEARVLPTGLPIIRAAYVALIDEDMALLGPLSMALTFGILILLFRSPRDIALPILVVVVTLTWTLGTMAAADKVVNQILQMTPVIIIIVGVSDAIHIVNRVQDLLAEAAEGADPREAIAEGCHEMAFACFLTSLTTVVGFLSLTTTNIETVVDFGLLTSAGVSYAYLITVTLLPAALGLWPPKPDPSRRRRGGARAWWAAPLRGLALSVQRGRGAVLGGAAVIALAAGVSLNWLDTTAYVFDDLHPGSPLEREIREADALYSGVLPIRVLLEGEPQALLEPEVVRAMAEIRRVLLAQPEVEVSRSLEQSIRRASYVWYDEDPAWDVVPASREGVSQFLLLLPREMQNDFIKRGMAVVTARTRDLGSTRLRPLLARVRAGLAPIEARLAERGVRMSLTGTTPLVQEVYDSIVGSLVSSVGVSVAFMALLFLLLFRSPKAALLALIPNFLPGLLLASALVLLGIALKPSTVIIFSVTFGIAVDDTIHVIARFRAERERGRGRAEAIERTVVQTGAAVVGTSLVLSAGFFVLGFSAFEGIANLGLLLGLGLGLALLCDLLVLPALLSATEVDFGPVGASDA